MKTEVVEAAPLNAVRVVPAYGPIELRVVGQTVDVAGGWDSRAKLAASIENIDPPYTASRIWEAMRAASPEGFGAVPTPPGATKARRARVHST